MCLLATFGALYWATDVVAESHQRLPIQAGDAPREGMHTGAWSSGSKEIFGTAYESYDNLLKYSKSSDTAPISKVWFTGTRGILTEVYWPTLDRPQVRDSQFMVSDGKTFVWKENDNREVKIEWLEEGVPAYHTTSQDPKGRFRIERTTYTDPDSDVLLQKVKIVKSVSLFNGFKYVTTGKRPNNSGINPNDFRS